MIRFFQIVAIYMLLTNNSSIGLFHNNKYCSISKCKKDIQCLSKTEFVVCLNFKEFALLFKEKIRCPKGYICDDSQNSPCVPENKVPSKDEHDTGFTSESSLADSSISGIETTITSYTESLETTFISPESPYDHFTSTEEELESSSTVEFLENSEVTSSVTYTTKESSKDAIIELTSRNHPETSSVGTSKPYLKVKCQDVGVGKHPAEKCNQYVECFQILFLFAKRLGTCEEGQIFSKLEKTCVAATNEELKCINL